MRNEEICSKSNYDDDDNDDDDDVGDNDDSLLVRLKATPLSSDWSAWSAARNFFQVQL